MYRPESITNLLNPSGDITIWSADYNANYTHYIHLWTLYRWVNYRMPECDGKQPSCNDAWHAPDKHSDHGQLFEKKRVAASVNNHTILHHKQVQMS